MMSKIEAHEEAEARKLINEQFVEITGKPMDMNPAGYYLALRLWVPPEKIITSNGVELFMPDTFRDERKYTSAVALVCAIGADAYSGDRFEKTGPWCKVGDWVIFPRYEGNAMSYRGVPMVLLPDDRILAVISDPTEIESINSART
jgi:co-chaperonin GroES (HSP10)